jgi:hypothetical protein
MSANDQQIIELLRSRVPYKQIEGQLGVSSKTIAAIAKNAGIVQRHRNDGKQGENTDIVNTSQADPAVLVENEILKGALTELYSFFKKVIAKPESMDKELDNLNTSVIDNGVKLCE